MALITIDGVALPTPTDLTVSIMDISSAFRNAKGSITIERIATKRKLEVQWSYLSRTDLQKVLTAVSKLTFKVTYLDPQTNANREDIPFYAGDRTCGFLDVIGGVPRYKDVRFDLIEV